MVTVVAAVWPVLVTDVATMVTVSGLGTEVGAVYVVAVPLPVEVADTLPHCVLAHLTVQVTPAFAPSLTTVAVSEAVVPTTSVEGGTDAKLTEIGPAGGGPGM
jgi:hypothetical protein